MGQAAVFFRMLGDGGGRAAGCLARLMSGAGIWAVVLAAVGLIVAVAGEDAPPFAQLAAEDHRSPVLALALSPSGSHQASFTMNGELRLTSLATACSQSLDC